MNPANAIPRLLRFFSLTTLALPALAQARIVPNDADSGRVFEGLGAISQGDTSRNFLDHHLAVSLKGEDMLVTVDGKEVTRVKDEGYANRRHGMACLISSYDPDCFNNLSVTP
jgi:hypothetical protein